MVVNETESIFIFTLIHFQCNIVCSSVQSLYISHVCVCVCVCVCVVVNEVELTHTIYSKVNLFYY